jgi:hypothetical protein
MGRMLPGPVILISAMRVSIRLYGSRALCYLMTAVGRDARSSQGDLSQSQTRNQSSPHMDEVMGSSPSGSTVGEQIGSSGLR